MRPVGIAALSMNPRAGYRVGLKLSHMKVCSSFESVLEFSRSRIEILSKNDHVYNRNVGIKHKFGSPTRIRASRTGRQGS